MVSTSLTSGRKMIVTRRELEQGLAELVEKVQDPRAGIYDTNSESWRLNRELVNFLGAGRAALLQLAHPPVAHAIAEHSVTRADVRTRFRRTFANIFAMTFGDLPSALAAARSVHATHAGITGHIVEAGGSYRAGSPYYANQSESLLWVHATLVDTIWAVRGAVFGELDAERRERHYQESKRFAALFGIPLAELPPDAGAFSAYVRRTLNSPLLAVGTNARMMADFLLAPATPALAPVARWYRAVTAGLMPPRLRAEFGLEFGPAERAFYKGSLPIIRSLYPRIPEWARFLPPYFLAAERAGLLRRRKRHRIARRVTGWIGFPDPAASMAPDCAA
jgi:uncharacterized protein (DUF2236 family)